jgi:hypothetical protein
MYGVPASAGKASDWPHCVLSKSRSLFSGDQLLKAVLNKKAIGPLNLFTASLFSTRVYVSDVIKRASHRAEVTGLDFLKVPCVSED